MDGRPNQRKKSWFSNKNGHVWKGLKIPYNLHCVKGTVRYSKNHRNVFIPMKFDFLKSGFYLTSIQQTELGG